MQQKNNNTYRRGQAPSARSGQALRLRSGQALRLRSGQAMIMTVLVLSSAVLSLSAIGGYLMLIRLRLSSDIVSTNKAIYVADAALECAAYNHFKNADVEGFCNSNGRDVFFFGGAAADLNTTLTTEHTPGPPSYIRATGGYGNSKRAFQIDF